MNTEPFQLHPPATRLRVGMVIEYDGRPFKVVLVNQSRAVIQPVVKQTRTVSPHLFDGETFRRKTFTVTVKEEYNISPNSEVPILK